MKSNTEKRFLFAVKALIFFGERFLLVRRGAGARKDYHGYWELPGGRLEFGESPEQALRREIFEETKLNFDPIRLIGTWSFKKAPNTQLVGVIYLCLASANNVCLSSEHDAYQWIMPSEIDDYKISEHLLVSMVRWDWVNLKEETSRLLHSQ